MGLKRYTILVRGRVQGVFFRKYTQIEGLRLKLAGYVRNLPDGSVEVVAEGNEGELQKLLAFCRKGPPAAFVSGVELEENAPTDEFDSFEIRY